MTRWQRKGADVWVKQGDTAPALAMTLKDGTGAVVNLTGVTGVTFVMWLPGAATAKVNAAATIVDAVGGQVSYSWQAANTDTPGDYLGEFQVTFGGGAIETFPNSGWLKVRIDDDLAA